MEKKMKKERNNGITLIALVITIIILLILAGISIGILTGENGVLSKASKAKEETEINHYKEQIELIRTELKLQNENYTSPTIEQIETALQPKEWIQGMEIITVEGTEKLKLTTKENYIFYITENEVSEIITSDMPKEIKISVYDEKSTSYKIWSSYPHTLTLSSEIEKGKYIVILNGSRANQSNLELTTGTIAFDYEEATLLYTNEYNDVIAQADGTQLLTISEAYLVEVNENKMINSSFTADYAMNMNFTMTILKY